MEHKQLIQIRFLQRGHGLAHQYHPALVTLYIVVVVRLPGQGNIRPDHHSFLQIQNNRNGNLRIRSQVHLIHHRSGFENFPGAGVFAHHPPGEALGQITVRLAGEGI
ncbi:hypothetical protein D3C81_1910620 [compost metagenome]